MYIKFEEVKSLFSFLCIENGIQTFLKENFADLEPEPRITLVVLSRDLFLTTVLCFDVSEQDMVK